MNKLLITIAISAMTLAGTAAYAADDHKGHDHSGKSGSHGEETKPAHGGVVTVVKDVSYELVASATSIALYVRDHGRAIDLKNASAKLTLLTGTERAEVELLPVGDRLEAKGSFKVGAGTKAVAQVKVDGPTPVSVRFALK